MKLALVIYGSLETVSGGYLYDRKLVEYLRAQGDSVEIISLPWQNYARHLLHGWDAHLAARLHRLDVELILQDELNHPSLFRLNRSLQPPLVSIVHHLRSSEQHARLWMPLYRWVERQYLNSVQAYIFNSETTRAVVQGLVGGGRPFVVATPAGDQFGGGLPSAVIAARCAQPGPLRLLFVGNLIPRKGLHTLLTALSMLPRQDWTLKIVGNLQVDGRYTAALRRQVAREGMEAQVTFCGSLPSEELAALWREQQVLISPSQYEGFGIVYLEGMGFGLPAIGSTDGAAGEIIRDAVDGYLVPPGDAGLLAARLAVLCADRARLRAMSLAARRRFDDFDGWAASAARIRAFLVGLAAHAGG